MSVRTPYHRAVTLIYKVRSSKVKLIKPKLLTFQEMGGPLGKEMEVCETANGEDGGVKRERPVVPKESYSEVTGQGG